MDDFKKTTSPDVEGGSKLEPEKKLTKKERAEIESQKAKEENKNNKKTDYVYNPKRGKILQLIFFLLLFAVLFGIGWAVRGCVS